MALTRRSAALWYTVLVVVVAFVNDGWSGRPSPLLHQLLLIPVTLAFTTCALLLLRAPWRSDLTGFPFRTCLGICVAFEALSWVSILYERHHFSRFGYGFGLARFAGLVGICAAAGTWALWKRTPVAVFAACLSAYAADLVFSIWSFPLNYLRSDMLPVILWADDRLVHGASPYGTIHVGARLYDFPYLPGMLLAYLPAVAVHIDERTVNLICMLVLSTVLFWAARADRRLEAALLIAVFLLSPFLQYRHELYLAPHWLLLVVSFVLMQRGRFGWGALIFGFSMAVYQLSWVLFPFMVLNALWRRGWAETLKIAAIGLVGMLAVLGPFLAAATRRIANNTVGQWSQLPHALADPINVSYWLTFAVRPDHLKWVQLAEMSIIFAYCVLRRRCETLTDMFRWMTGALAVFIASNVLVDGYFYLTWLLLALVYTISVTGIWTDPALVGAQQRLRRTSGPGLAVSSS